MKPKPKRPDRKRIPLVKNWKHAWENADHERQLLNKNLAAVEAQCFEKDCKIEGQRRALEAAEADKREYYDHLQSIGQAIGILAGEPTALILERIKKLQTDNRILQDRNAYLEKTVAEHVDYTKDFGALRAERDALANRVKSLEEQNETLSSQLLGRRELPPIRTTCQMQFSKDVLPVRYSESKDSK